MRIRHIVIVAALVFTLAYAALRLITAHGGAMPTNGWIAAVVLVVLAALVLAAGWPVRAYLKGQAVVIPDPQRARRALVAAQACALAGGAMAGWYLAQAGIHARSLDMQRSSSAFVLCLALTCFAAGLSAAGLVVQAWCRIDDHHDDDPDAERDDESPQPSS